MNGFVFWFVCGVEAARCCCGFVFGGSDLGLGLDLEGEPGGSI